MQGWAASVTLARQRWHFQKRRLLVVLQKVPSFHQYQSLCPKFYSIMDGIKVAGIRNIFCLWWFLFVGMSDMVEQVQGRHEMHLICSVVSIGLVKRMEISTRASVLLTESFRFSTGRASKAGSLLSPNPAKQPRREEANVTALAKGCRHLSQYQSFVLRFIQLWMASK